MRNGIVLVLAALATAGCEGGGLLVPSPVGGQRPKTQPASPGAGPAASRPEGAEVMATVNGEPVYMAPLYDMLLREPVFPARHWPSA